MAGIGFRLEHLWVSGGADGRLPPVGGSRRSGSCGGLAAAGGLVFGLLAPVLRLSLADARPVVYAGLVTVPLGVVLCVQAERRFHRRAAEILAALQNRSSLARLHVGRDNLARSVSDSGALLLTIYAIVSVLGFALARFRPQALALGAGQRPLFVLFLALGGLQALLVYLHRLMAWCGQGRSMRTTSAVFAVASVGAYAAGSSLAPGSGLPLWHGAVSYLGALAAGILAGSIGLRSVVHDWLYHLLMQPTPCRPRTPERRLWQHRLAQKGRGPARAEGSP